MRERESRLRFYQNELEPGVLTVVGNAELFTEMLEWAFRQKLLISGYGPGARDAGLEGLEPDRVMLIAMEIKASVRNARRIQRAWENVVFYTIRN